MELPDKALFTIKETGQHLALSRATVYRLIKDGLLEVKHPTPRSTRITRESLAAHLGPPSGKLRLLAKGLDRRGPDHGPPPGAHGSGR